jgi:hypothetical protein
MSMLFWDETQSGLAGRHQHFGGTHCLHCLTPEDGYRMFLRNVGIYKSTWRHIPIDQRILISAVITLIFK